MDFYGQWNTIEKSEGTWPSLTICQESSGFTEAKSDMCTELGVSLMWRNAKIDESKIKFNTTVTDHGMCCNVMVENTGCASKIRTL